MQRRPHLGRVGAGVLTCLAAFAVSQAVSFVGPSTVRAQAEPRAAAVLAGPLHSTESLVSGAAEYHATLPTPAPAPMAVVPPGRQSLHVPILMYHYIRVNPDRTDKLGFNLSVTPSDFNAQMDYLAANGYHPVDFNDLRLYWDHGVPLPPKPVVLTFDDGYKDIYTTAYPILKAHGFKAVSYVVSGFVGSNQNINAAQVQEMDQNGIEIGAHTFSHVDLTKTSDAELHRQLVDSKAMLEAWVGHPVVDFCYPSGQLNGRVADAVRAAGYLDATTTQPGTVHSLGDRFTWSRVRVSGGESLAQFAADLGPAETAVTVLMAPPPPRKITYSMLPRLPLIVGGSVFRALLPGTSLILRPPSFH